MTRPPIGRSILLVAGVAWLSSLPWAVLHGPVSPAWVVGQAVGAAVIPFGIGCVALWRTRGDRSGALRVTVGSAAVLLALQVWSLTHA